ncbi:MAG: hypothetical protein ACHRHE_03580, partial [Tepidisphaerales bacterium]
MAKTTEEQPAPGQNDNVQQMADLFRKLTALAAPLQPPAEPLPPTFDRGALVRRLKNMRLAAEALPPGPRQVLCAIIDEQLNDLQPSAKAVEAQPVVPSQLSSADKEQLARDLRYHSKLLIGLAENPRPNERPEDDPAPIPGVGRRAMQRAGWLIMRAVCGGLISAAIDPKRLPADVRAMMNNYPSIRQQVLRSGKHPSTELGWDWGLVACRVPLNVIDGLSDKYPEKLSSELTLNKDRYSSHAGHWLGAPHSYRKAAWVCRTVANLISPRRSREPGQAKALTPLPGMVSTKEIHVRYPLNKAQKERLRKRFEYWRGQNPGKFSIITITTTNKRTGKVCPREAYKHPGDVVHRFAMEILGEAGEDAGRT